MAKRKNNHYKMKNKPKKKQGLTLGKFMAYVLLPITIASAGMVGGYYIAKNNVEPGTGNVSTQTPTQGVNDSKIKELTTQLQESATKIKNLETQIEELEVDAEANATEILELTTQLQEEQNTAEALRIQLDVAELDSQTLIGLYTGDVKDITISNVSTLRSGIFNGLNLNSLTLNGIETINYNVLNNVNIQNLTINGENVSILDEIQATNLTINATNQLDIGQNGFQINVSGELNINCRTLFLYCNVINPTINVNGESATITCDYFCCQGTPGDKGAIRIQNENAETIFNLGIIYTGVNHLLHYENCESSTIIINNSTYGINNMLSMMTGDCDITIQNNSDTAITINQLFINCEAKVETIHFKGNFVLSENWNKVNNQYIQINNVIIDGDIQTSSNQPSNTNNGVIAITFTSNATNSARKCDGLFSSAITTLYVSQDLVDKYGEDVCGNGYAVDLQIVEFNEDGRPIIKE